MKTTRILSLLIPLLVVSNARSQTSVTDSPQAQVAASSMHTNTLWEALKGKVDFGLDVGVTKLQDLNINQINGRDLPYLIGPGTTLDKAIYKFNPGIRVDLSARCRFTDSLSLGLETGFIYDSVDKRERSLTIFGTPLTQQASVSNEGIYEVPILADMVYRFPTTGRLKPYVGVGLGGAVTILDVPEPTQSDFTFAYQGVAGVSVDIAEQWDMGLGYKFLGTLDHDLGIFKTDPTYTHCVFVSWTYRY
jgi:opacity protein-like surface antigen